MDLMDLLKLAGISVQMQPSEPSCGCGGSCGCGMSESDGAGFDKATTEPNPEELPDGISTLGSVSDTSLRRYLKAKGDHVTVDENIYPDYTVEDVAESYKAFTEKAKNPYAIGMAQAMKSTGDEPPLKKSTIKKAHDIAKAVNEAELSGVSTITEADPALQQLRKEVWNAIREIQTGAAAGKDMTDDILDELGDYYDDVQASGDPDLIKSYTEVRLDAPDQPPRVQAKIALLAMNAILNAHKRDKAVKEAGPVLQQLRKEVWSAIREIQTGAAAGKDMTDDILDELGDYYDDVQASGDPDLIKAYTEVRLDAPDQPPRVQAKIALLAMNAIKKKAPVKEGAAKGSMIKDAETMSKADFIKKYGAENADTWKNINETAKPDFLDMDKDGDKKEPMKKAAKDKEETKANESLEYLKKLAGLE